MWALEKGIVNLKTHIGKDTRISGNMLEAALAKGIIEAGGNVITVGVIPTPAVAYLTKYYDAAAGIVISASHNPSLTIEDSHLTVHAAP